MSIVVQRIVAGSAFGLGLGLLIYGFAFGDDNTGRASAAPEPTDTPTVTQTVAATPRNTIEPTATTTEVPSPTPTPFDGTVAAMRIPRFDVDAAIEDIGLDDKNQLEVPADPHNVGWYGIYADRDRRPGGAYQKPGWGSNAVFSAHVDYYPDIRGPFYHMADMEVGDEIVVVMDNGIEYQYRVISNTQYKVEDIPTGDLIKARDRPQADEWITLITCGGTFVPFNGTDGPGHYAHRDVVVAERFQ